MLNLRYSTYCPIASAKGHKGCVNVIRSRSQHSGYFASTLSFCATKLKCKRGNAAAKGNCCEGGRLMTAQCWLKIGQPQVNHLTAFAF